jgi:hypothetical protein
LWQTIFHQVKKKNKKRKKTAQKIVKAGNIITNNLKATSFSSEEGDKNKRLSFIFLTEGEKKQTTTVYVQLGVKRPEFQKPAIQSHRFPDCCFHVLCPKT